MVKDGIFLGNRYEVIEKIGSGGMADVYKGRDTMLNRYVAIKVLKKEFREDETFVKKFRSEAQAAAGLLNPNIVNVYDVGEDRGLYYMVMELVEGITLKEYIDRKKRLSAREVISIAIQMCSGIEEAHKHHIIHRDIKPQNIIISNDGKVKVTDFGIARMVTSKTTTTVAMGSVHYTSPEQARGGYSDEKSDIYSIGITLYEMVTGQVPFNGDTTVEVAMKHLQEEITPPSELVPDIPYSLEQIILKCTQKNAERRYSDVDELIQDLKHSLVDPDGDFVQIVPVGNADTVIITEDDLDDIRSSYGDDDEDDEYGEDDDYGEDDEDYEDDEDGEDHDSDEVNPRMNKVIKIMTIVVAVIIILVLALVIGRAAGLFRFGGTGTTQEEDSGQVKVPNVVGMSLDDAKAELNNAGLGWKIGKQEESAKYEKGYVMAQDPKNGEKVKKNTQITLDVSTGKTDEQVEVPNVVGQDEADAQKTLEDAGFKVESAAVYSSQPQGEVVSTDPEAGTQAAKGSTVTIQVSKGEQKISVPDVRGTDENTAKSTLSGAGLNVTVTTDYSDSVAQGNVISQDPSGGTKVDAGANVNIVVSLGSRPVSVPSVVGVSESNARQLIASAGLSVGSVTYREDSAPAGQVISCDPGVGASVSRGASVNLVVSQGQSSSPGDSTETPEEPDTEEGQ
ncbi:MULTISPECIES: Stk1 family PASTA domain-containing Ser/Thr kinase [Clostridia]|uniref:non-specific serine/threonine protein kinase n=1 Tax=Faecalicatena fissicatena TaxID=290055 RepID=A0ABS2EC30_9FIRM|nr:MULTISPECIES: Stk1 family PASTA domain-containing Ser/Thr kinase [Clostridia]MBM6739186.1 Stk1 family PASTA domain-containing Ser/Thr kinase [Faecalicatena fissicatena]